MYDVIIIGKGPAGISAALYTHRANLKTLVVGRNNSSVIKAHSVDNYYGVPKISGADLIQTGINQAKDLGIEIVDEEVISMGMEESFIVLTKNNKFEAKTVLMATGQPYKKINIENVDNLEGKGISYCTTCDGFFYKGLKVGVLGYNDFTIHEANELTAFTKDIVIFTNGRKLELSETYENDIKNFEVVEDEIIKFDGNEFLDSVVFKNGKSEKINGMFIAYGSASSTDFARKLGILTNDDQKSIKVDQNYMTSLEGVFAAGDCIGGFNQISTAVGEGAIAAKSIIKFAREN
ncbi:MAG: NAD(P)/FAD-dependent oxidoreductase [Clostridiales bacterium]